MIIQLSGRSYFHNHSTLFLVAFSFLLLLSCGEPPRQDFHGIKTGLSCEQALNEKNAYYTYMSVHSALMDGVKPKNIQYLDCFLVEEDIRYSAKKTLENFMRKAFVPNVLYAYLHREYKRLIKKDIEFGKGRLGGLVWSTHHRGRASAMAFRRTGEKRFIADFISYFKEVMERRDSQLGRHDVYHDKIMDSWGSKRLDGEQWISMVTHFSVIMEPATEIALLIKTNPELSEYSYFTEEIVSYFKTAYQEFDGDRREIDGEYWYWRPVEEEYEATNHGHLMGETLLNMYALTKDPFYADRIQTVLNIFEKGVEIDEEGWVAWNYHPYFQVEKSMNDMNALFDSEKVWKAGLTTPFVFRADTAGFDIDPKLIAAIEKNILENILVDGEYASNLHPKESVPIEEDKQNRKEQQNSIVLFLPATIQNEEVSDRILEIVSTRPDLFPGGWLRNPMVRGYAYFLDDAQ